MIKIYSRKILNSEFDYIIYANAKNLTFLNYNIISQKQIVDINNDEFFANANVFTPLNLSKKKFKNDVCLLNKLI